MTDPSPTLFLSRVCEDDVVHTKMMTCQGLRRFDCCPGHNPRSYKHGRERAREEREWRRDATLDAEYETAACRSS